MSNEQEMLKPKLLGEIDEATNIYTAISPIGIGQIEFFNSFKGRHYNTMSNAMSSQDEDVASYYECAPTWRAVCALGTVTVSLKTTKNGEEFVETYTNKTSYLDVDFRILLWAHNVFLEWVAPFLAGSDWHRELSMWLRVKQIANRNAKQNRGL